MARLFKVAFSFAYCRHGFSCQVPWGCALVPADLLHQLQSEVCKQVDSKIATCSFLRAFQASILDFEIVDSISQIVKAKQSSCDWLEDSIALLYTFTLLFSACCLSIGKQDRLASAAPTHYRKRMAFVLNVTCVIFVHLVVLISNRTATAYNRSILIMKMDEMERSRVDPGLAARGSRSPTCSAAERAWSTRSTRGLASESDTTTCDPSSLILRALHKL